MAVVDPQGATDGTGAPRPGPEPHINHASIIRINSFMRMQDRLANLLSSEPETPNLRRLFDEPVTTAELLAAWREATRAAELTQRLAEVATESAEQAEMNAVGAEEIADLAEQTALAAARAAKRARAAAVHARELARQRREEQVSGAEASAARARAAEAEARTQYHEAEADVWRRLGTPAGAEQPG